MKRSFLLSLLIIGLVAAWMLSGQTDGEAKPAAGVNQTREAAEAPFKVLVVPLESGTVTRQVIVQGQLEPDRVLAMRAETSGQVLEIGVRKGERVTRGQLLISLAEDDRPARIAGARAELAQQQLQMEGANRCLRLRLRLRLRFGFSFGGRLGVCLRRGFRCRLRHRLTHVLRHLLSHGLQRAIVLRRRDRRLRDPLHHRVGHLHRAIHHRKGRKAQPADHYPRSPCLQKRRVPPAPPSLPAAIPVRLLLTLGGGSEHV